MRSESQPVEGFPLLVLLRMGFSDGDVVVPSREKEAL
jgi:hypothetical protein